MDVMYQSSKITAQYAQAELLSNKKTDLILLWVKDTWLFVY